MVEISAMSKGVNQSAHSDQEPDTLSHFAERGVLEERAHEELIMLGCGRDGL